MTDSCMQRLSCRRQHLLASRGTIAWVVGVAALATSACGHHVAGFDPARELAGRVGDSLGVRFAHIDAGSLRHIPRHDFLIEEPVLSNPPVEPPTAATYDLVILEPYFISTTEITCGQWERVMATTPWIEAEDHPTRDDEPAVVTWLEAVRFCRTLTELLAVKGARVRLPLEIEWEYAARAGARTHFCFGDDAEQLGEFAWHTGNLGDESYRPVGTKKSNAWGMHDMHGSVWEWCADLRGGEQYPVPTEWAARDAVYDAEREFLDAARAVRGGGPKARPFHYWADYRMLVGAQRRTSRIGFRVVVSADHGTGRHQGWFVPH